MQLSYSAAQENQTVCQAHARSPHRRETLRLTCAPASLVRGVDRALTAKELDMCCRATD